MQMLRGKIVSGKLVAVLAVPFLPAGTLLPAYGVWMYGLINGHTLPCLLCFVDGVRELSGNKGLL